MKSIIICEKPSVAATFCKVLNVRNKKDGYVESDDYYITWCFGHLIELFMPEDYDEALKKWQMETLPILPSEYKYKVKNDTGIKKQFKVIKELYHKSDVDTLYLAGDPAREGIYIQFLVLQKAGILPSIKKKVIWIDSQTEEEIKKGIKEAKDIEYYQNLADSGYMRAIEDFSSGINLSRALSLKYGTLISRANGRKYGAISVGRVMSCVLGMVVEQERKVLSHKESYFYKVVASFVLKDGTSIDGEFNAVEGSRYYESPLLYQDKSGIKTNGFEQKKDAEALCAASIPSETNPYIIKSVETSTSKQYAPLLFNIADLQNECSKKLHISPDKTLELTQSLYEKKLVTYPRTDARVLSTAIAKEIEKNLKKLQVIKRDEIEHIKAIGLYKTIARSKYTDDSKISDHYAIIPTGENLGVLKSLSMAERSVFDIILTRFLCIFYEPCTYQNIKAVLENNGEKFFFSEKYISVPGFKKLLPTKEDSLSDVKFKYLSALKGHEGSPAPIKICQVKEGKAAAPKRFTSGSLILAMENAGKYIEEDELRERIKGSGVGTSATRAEIIKKLVRIKYLALNEKTQIVSPTNEGNMVYECLHLTLPELLNPKLTANWEMGLDKIVDGTISRNDFTEKMNRTIIAQVNKIKDGDISTELADAIKPFATEETVDIGPVETSIACPLCGSRLIRFSKGYGCKAHRDTGCPFFIGIIVGKFLTESQVKELIHSGELKKVDGFKKKDGTKFSAGLILEDAIDKSGTPTKMVRFVDFKKPVDLDVSCPKCHNKTIYKEAYQVKCKTCDFVTQSWVARKQLTDQQISDLLEKGKTSLVKGLKKKSGGTFSARIVLDADTGKLSFETKRR